MSEWTDELARAMGVTPPDDGQETALLDAAREIAHRSARKDTPLSTYIVGVAAGARIASGSSPQEAFTKTLAELLSLLPAERP